MILKRSVSLTDFYDESNAEFLRVVISIALAKNVLVTSPDKSANERPMRKACRP
jgi:hypothetical protein